MPKHQKKRKWRADEAVSAAAQRHLEKIVRASRRIVGAEPDHEAVHDFRVGIRRLRTVLRAARQVYGKKRIKTTIADLKRFGDATNALRDEEVLSETLAPLVLTDDTADEVDRWLKLRAVRKRQLRARANRFLHGSELPRCIRRVEKLLKRGPVEKQALGAFADEQLTRAQREVSKLIGVRKDDTDGLHTLRIHFKRLRYTAEMLDDFTARMEMEGLFSKRIEDEPSESVHYGTIARRAARLQESLGLLHDADVAFATIGRARSLSNEHAAALTEALAARRSELVTAAFEQLRGLPPDTLGSPTN